MLKYLHILCIMLLFVAFGLNEAENLSRDPHEAEEEKEREQHEGIGSRIKESRENFTSCDEYLGDSKIDVSKVVDVVWTIFYLWLDKLGYEVGPKDTILSYRVSYQHATPSVVRRYSGELDDEIKGVNWTAAELTMDTNKDYSALLLATNRSGLYDVLPAVGFEEKLNKNEIDQFALRMVEPHYLGVLDCKYRQLVLMSPLESRPLADKIDSVVKQFNFRGDKGVSYLEVESQLKMAAKRKIVTLEEDDRDFIPEYDVDENQLSVL